MTTLALWHSILLHGDSGVRNVLTYAHVSATARFVVEMRPRGLQLWSRRPNWKSNPPPRPLPGGLSLRVGRPLRDAEFLHGMYRELDSALESFGPVRAGCGLIRQLGATFDEEEGALPRVFDWWVKRAAPAALPCALAVLGAVAPCAGHLASLGVVSLATNCQPYLSARENRPALANVVSLVALQLHLERPVLESMPRLRNLAVIGSTDNCSVDISGVGLSNPCLASLMLYGCALVTSLDPLCSLESLSSLTLEYCGGQPDLTVLRRLRHLRCLRIQRLPDKQWTAADFAALQSLSRLSDLSLGCEQLTSVELLRGCGTELRSLALIQCGEALRTLAGLDSALAPHLRVLLVDECHGLEHAPLDHLRGLEELAICSCPALVSVHCPADAFLAKLTLSCCDTLSTLPIAGCTGLVHLKVEACASVQSIDCPESLQHSLRTLELEECGRLRFVNVSRCTCLEELLVAACRELQEVAGLSQKSCLRKLQLSETQSLHSDIDLAGSESVEVVFLSDMELLRSVTGFACDSRLRDFHVIEVHGLVTLDFTGAADLTRVVIEGSSNLQAITGLTGKAHLRTLHLNDCRLTTLDLTGCRSLSHLNLDDCSLLQSIDSFGTLPHLRQLSLGRLPALRSEVDVTCCRHELASVSFHGYPRIEEVGGLAECDSLHSASFTSWQSAAEADMAIVWSTKVLSFRHCPAATLLYSTVDMARMTTLEVSVCSALTVIDAQSFVALTHFAVSSCPLLERVHGLARTETLTTVSLFFCDVLASVDCCRDKLRGFEVGTCPRLSEGMPGTIV